jgi:hypothetical protein
MRVRNKELRSARHRKEQRVKEIIKDLKANKAAAPKAEAKPKAEPKPKAAAKPKAEGDAKPKKAPAKKKTEEAPAAE